MIKEAIGTGKTLDEARESAVLKLNAKETDDIQFEVITMAKPKTLGLFGGCKAEVRAFIEIPDKKPKKEKPKAEKKSAKPEKKAEPKVQKTTKKEVSEKAEVKPFGGVPMSELENGTPADRAAKYLFTILENLGVKNPEILVETVDNGAKFVLKGDNLGVVIGRRGETLDALQHLTSLAASDKESKYYRIMLDTENYRGKREKTLQSLAKRTALSALRSGRQRSLEPMNPYERRIIHTAVQEIEGVSSHSVGEGDRRHVVITSDSKKPMKSAKQTDSTVATAPKKIDDFGSLYGRID